MQDETEAYRRQMIESGQPYQDLAFTPEHMRWTTEQLRIDFEVVGFLAPYVVVRRKFDGVLGSMEFTHHPRFYFNFQPDTKGTTND